MPFYNLFRRAIALKITYEQFYGSGEKIDLQLIKPILHLENTPEYEALEQGWAVNNGVWYNSRSTRIKLKEYDKPKRVSGYKFNYHKTLNKDQFENVEFVYQAFLDYKGFNRIYELIPNDPRTAWILCESDKIRAFTMFTEYDGALESNLTAWDYSEIKRSIGKYIVGYEVQIARERNLEYLYLGAGYGKSALYKAYIKGFQWWTGSEWSENKEKYISLCQRDDTIQTLDDLSKIYAFY
jgi:hypothetical protein